MRAIFGFPALFVQTLLVVFVVPLLIGLLLVTMQVTNFKDQYAANADGRAQLIASSIPRMGATVRSQWFAQLLRLDEQLPVLGIELREADGLVVSQVGIAPGDGQTVHTATTRAGQTLSITVPPAPTRSIWLRGLLVTLTFSAAASLAFCIAIWPTVSSIGRSLDDVVRVLHTFRQSNFNARATEQGYGRFALLERAVNRMGAALLESQQRTLEIVDHTTDELQSTLEEVEIKNVELDLARKRAVKNAQEKSRFLANMSHEIRTPMNSIVGYAQLLEATQLEPSQRGYADSITQSARTLLEIIEDILSLSRLEAGKLALATQEFDIRHICAQSIEMLAPAAYQKKLQLRTLIHPSVPICFVGDPLRIRQIVVNFLTNAVKFTDHGSVELIIGARRQTERNALLNITVRDTGRGIARKDRSKLFDAFTDTSKRELGGGTGLGLTIARALTNAMGGQLSLLSELDEGSSFSVQLPLKTNFDLQFEFLLALKNRTIALAIDDEPLAEHIRGHLDALGIHWRALDGGAQTIDGAAVDGCDFVLMHVQPDEADTLLERWDAAWPTPVVLIASADNRLLHRVADALDGYVLPAHVSATRILAQMARHLGATVADVETGLGEPSLPKVKGRRVLIADDDRLGRLYLEELLTQHGVRVTACADGQQAVTVARDVAFDAIFLDARMPVCDGEQAARQIRAMPQHHDTPLYALTASAMDEDKVRFAAAGMNECLIKPASAHTLLSAIAKGQETPEPASAPPSTATSLGSDKQMLELLHKELREYRLVLNEHSTDDSARIFDVAHRLHGAASICEMPQLRDKAAALELAARARDAPAIVAARDHLLTEIDGILDHRGVAHSAHSS